MTDYQVGDCLCFHTERDSYGIKPGDTAVIVGNSRHGFCVRFDRCVGGHNCNLPDVVPSGHGWWLEKSDLDRFADIIENESEISASDLEEVL